MRTAGSFASVGRVCSVAPTFSASAPASSGSIVSSAVRYGRRSPKTTACEIQRLSFSAFSMFEGEMFLPLDVMMRSFLRPVIER